MGCLLLYHIHTLMTKGHEGMNLYYPNAKGLHFTDNPKCYHLNFTIMHVNIPPFTMPAETVHRTNSTTQ